MIAPKTIKLTINGIACSGRDGQTILEIARAHNVYPRIRGFMCTGCEYRHACGQKGGRS